jgi:hypothetical protein
MRGDGRFREPHQRGQTAVAPMFCISHTGLAKFFSPRFGAPFSDPARLKN